MKTRHVIEGVWEVEDPLWNQGLPPPVLQPVGAATPALSARPRLVGTLTIDRERYRFVSQPGVAAAQEAPRRVAFVTPPSGRVVIHYDEGVTAETDVTQLARPPAHGGYLQALPVARLKFPDARLSTDEFRVWLDVDGTSAHFSPDFHANIYNWPFHIVRRIRPRGNER